MNKVLYDFLLCHFVNSFFLVVCFFDVYPQPSDVVSVPQTYLLFFPVLLFVVCFSFIPNLQFVLSCSCVLMSSFVTKPRYSVQLSLLSCLLLFDANILSTAAGSCGPSKCIRATDSTCWSSFQFF